MRDYTLIVFLFAITACREDAVEGASGQMQTVGGQNNNQGTMPPQQGGGQQPVPQQGMQTPPTKPIEPAVGMETAQEMRSNVTQDLPSTPTPNTESPSIVNAAPTPIEEATPEKKDTPKAPQKIVASARTPTIELVDAQITGGDQGGRTYTVAAKVGNLDESPTANLEQRLKKAAYADSVKRARIEGYNSLQGHRIQDKQCDNSICSARIEFYFSP